MENFTCVNKVYSFSYLGNYNLKTWKFYTKPKMFVYKIEKNYTILLFKSENRRGRIMGRNASYVALLQHFNEHDISNFKLQTQTYFRNYNCYISIDKMTKGIYEPELFMGRQIQLKNKNVIIVFYNGKVILLGKNCLTEEIVDEIDNLINDYKYIM